MGREKCVSYTRERAFRLSLPGEALEVVVVKLVAAKANLNALVSAGCVATQALAPVASDLFAVGVSFVGVGLIFLVGAVSCEAARDPLGFEVRVEDCLVSLDRDGLLCLCDHREGVGVAVKVFGNAVANLNLAVAGLAQLPFEGVLIVCVGSAKGSPVCAPKLVVILVGSFGVLKNHLLDGGVLFGFQVLKGDSDLF